MTTISNYRELAEHHGISPAGFLDGGHGSLDDWGDWENLGAAIETCVAYLSQHHPKATFPANSYALKHRAEKWGQSVGMEPYVPNGALLIAAYHLGLGVKRLRQSLNGEVSAK